NQTDVERRVRWVERGVLVFFVLYCDRFEVGDESGGAKNRGRAQRWIRAVCFASFYDHFGERITLARANRFQRGWLADDAVTHTQGFRIGQSLRTAQSDFLVRCKYHCERFL